MGAAVVGVAAAEDSEEVVDVATTVPLAPASSIVRHCCADRFIMRLKSNSFKIDEDREDDDDDDEEEMGVVAMAVANERDGPFERSRFSWNARNAAFVSFICVLLLLLFAAVRSLKI